MKNRSITVVCLVLAMALTGCVSTGGNLPPLETVERVDIDRYTGQWYVIANIPYFAERGNVAPRVIYERRDDGRLDDLYFYRDDFGEPEEDMRGVAWIVDESTNAQWKTRFIWPFTFDYYILALDETYSTVAVGHPSRDYAWIMARDKTISDDRYKKMLDVFARQGWDTSRIQKIPQLSEQVGKNGFQSPDA